MHHAIILSGIIFCMACLSVAPGFSQNAQVGVPAPLELSVTQEQGKKSLELKIVLKNVSPRDVMGYVVRVDFYNEAGVLVTTVTKQGQRNRLVFEHHKYSAGASWAVNAPVPFSRKMGRHLTDHRVSVDFVLLEDGTSWGPDTLKRADSIKAFADGVRAATAAMRDKLEHEGASAVERDLRAASLKRLGTKKK